MLSRRRLLGVGLLCSLIVGCGSSAPHDGGEETADETPEVVRCLLASGAKLAHEPSDVAFYAEDERNGEVDKVASAFHGEVAVHEYQPVAEAGAASPYVLFTVQPAESRLTPLVILEQGAARSHVAYLLAPTQSDVADADRCLGFGRDGV